MQNVLYSFQPNAKRACDVDSRVRAGLARSLSTVFDALADGARQPVDSLTTRMRSGPVPPAVFALYTDLVEAIFADKVDLARKLAEELRTLDLSHADDLRIVTLSDDHLGKGQSERYARLVDDDPEFGLELQPITPADLSRASALINKTLTLVDTVIPELAGEIRNLVREIVLVDSNDADFGATSFQVWGALFLKMKDHWGRVEIAEALAHESAHALLFAFAMGKPLVRNEAGKLYASPLRSDPRPMDGVVHATYVVARMHYTVLRLAESGLLTNEEQLVALEARKRNAERYEDGCAVIDNHADWTPEGKTALDSARDYMTSQT